MLSIARRSLRPNRLKSIVTRSFSATEKEYLVLNAVGEDRPGIVADFTKIVVDQGGNVGESQASRLGSHFGLMMLVSVPSTQSSALQDAVQNMQGMTTSCYITSNPDSVEINPQVGYMGHFELSGADNIGLVYEVTSILAKHGLNIDELKTYEDSSAPLGGTSLFYMSGIATASAPLAKGFDPQKIQDELEELGEAMNCDITIDEVNEDNDSSAFGFE